MKLTPNQIEHLLPPRRLVVRDSVQEAVGMLRLLDL